MPNKRRVLAKAQTLLVFHSADRPTVKTALRNGRTSMHQNPQSVRLPLASQNAPPLPSFLTLKILRVGDVLALKTQEKCLDLWNDWVALSKAQVALMDKSRDLWLGISLRARITGMLGLLNLYLDPGLQYTWREASAMVATIQGRGVKRAQKLWEWALTFARYAKLPELHYSHA